MNKTEQIFLITSTENQASSSSQKTIEVPATSQVNLENVEDFSNVCRTCASVSEFLMPIFEGEGLQTSLAEKIHKHLPIQVSEHDMLPRALCYQCAQTLLACHELAARSTLADAALRARANQPTPATGLHSQKSTFKEEDPVLKHLQHNEWKTCTNSPEPQSMQHDTTNEKDEIEITIKPDDDDDLERASTPQSDDDQPLSAIAARKSNHLYNDFYTALINFRNHFVTEHKSQNNYPDFTDSSDSEMMPEEIGDDEDTNVDNFDDLTQSNMRKDRLDEETRLELGQVQIKINGKVYYSCKVCGKNLSSSHTYVFHKRIHTGERPCVCHVCGKQFRAPNGLQRHLTETHEKLRRHSCRYCPKNFANSQNLKQHMRIHTGERPFVCSQCGKRFTQSGSLYVHLKTHSEQFPYQCAECGAKFRLRSGLARHRLKHTGERPHVCVHCGKGFRQKHEMNSHSLSHTDSKPFSCVICGAAFRQRRALRHHTKRLHETEQTREAAGPVVARVSNMLIYTNIGQYQ